ncbi:MAG: hypothetical protein IKA36_04965 [Clostridia bacterium]|nr:hypothetical protein [Clostridia bacterium]
MMIQDKNTMGERKEDAMEKLTYSESLIITAGTIVRNSSISDEKCVSLILDIMVDIRKNHSGIDETTETGMMAILSLILSKELPRNEVATLLDEMLWGFKKMLSNIKAAVHALSLVENPIIINKDADVEMG